MKSSILTIFIILTVAIAFCSLFIFTSGENNNSAVLASNGNGVVLGIADNNITVSAGSSFNYIGSLPQNSDKKNVPPQLKDGSFPPDLSNLTYLVMDKASGAILLQNNENKKTAIASITKLITALVFLEQNLDWEASYKIKSGDIVGGGKSNIAPGDEIKLKDLFFLSLVGSDNSAAVALARATGLSDEQFVEKLNSRAKNLGLSNTNFSDPTGLSDSNTSTAFDVAKLSQVALDRKEVREATLTKNYYLITTAGIKKSVRNTDILLDIFPQNGIKIAGGKTGYTTNAGYCFVGQFTDGNGHEIVSVVLGESDIKARFETTKFLVHWTYDNFVW